MARAQIENLEDQLRQTNERLLLSAFDAQDSAERANSALVLLDAVLRQMPGGVIIADSLTGKITLSNATSQILWPDCACIADMARHFAANCERADGTRCTSDDLPLSRSLKTGRMVTREEIRFRRGDGSRGDMTIDSGVVRNAKGDIVAVVSTCEDITEEKAVAQREQAAVFQLRELSAKLESAREEERTHISRELHDELGQSLTALQLDLAWLLKEIPRDRIAMRQRTESMIEATKRTIVNVRQLASDLRPSILDNFGLIPAIEWQVSEFQKRTGIRARLKTQGDLPIDRERSTVVFRVVQEALTNVMRHAQATSVNVMLRINRHSLLLKVDDNGRGIRPAEIARTNSLGIVGMHERVMRFGGELEIGPRSRGGTHLEVSIPLRREEPSSAVKGRRVTKVVKSQTNGTRSKATNRNGQKTRQKPARHS